MPVITPGNVEIILTKPPFDPLAEGMAELATEASGLPFTGRQSLR